MFIKEKCGILEICRENDFGRWKWLVYKEMLIGFRNKEVVSYFWEVSFLL